MQEEEITIPQMVEDVRAGKMGRRIQIIGCDSSPPGAHG